MGGGGSGAPQRIYLKTLSVSRQNDDQEPLIVLRYMSWGYCFKLFFVRAALTGPQTETFKGSVTGATFPDPPLRGVMGLKRPSPPPRADLPPLSYAGGHQALSLHETDPMKRDAIAGLADADVRRKSSHAPGGHGPLVKRHKRTT